MAPDFIHEARKSGQYQVMTISWLRSMNMRFSFLVLLIFPLSNSFGAAPEVGECFKIEKSIKEHGSLTPGIYRVSHQLGFFSLKGKNVPAIEVQPFQKKSQSFGKSYLIPRSDFDHAKAIKCPIDNSTSRKVILDTVVAAIKKSKIEIGTPFPEKCPEGYEIESQSDDQMARREYSALPIVARLECSGGYHTDFIFFTLESQGSGYISRIEGTLKQLIVCPNIEDGSEPAPKGKILRLDGPSFSSPIENGLKIHVNCARHERTSFLLSSGIDSFDFYRTGWQRIVNLALSEKEKKPTPELTVEKLISEAHAEYSKLQSSGAFDRMPSLTRRIVEGIHKNMTSEDLIRSSMKNVK